MSRLIDKLTRIRKAEPQPLGFALSRNATESPKLQLLACVASDNIEKYSAQLSSVDTLIVAVNKADDLTALDKVCNAKDGTPGGGWLKASSSGTIKKALNITCDFVIFPSDIQLTSIPKDKVGRILEIDPSWSELMLRTISELPVDAVFIAGKDTELTLNRLMQLQLLVYLAGKPVLASVPAALSAAELQALWDMGIGGIVVDVNDEESAKGLADLRQGIYKLAPPAFRKKNRGSPILPRISPEEPKPQEGEEEEEES